MSTRCAVKMQAIDGGTLECCAEFYSNKVYKRTAAILAVEELPVGVQYTTDWYVW